MNKIGLVMQLSKKTIILVSLIMFACSTPQDKYAKISKYDLDVKSNKNVEMPEELKEISGIAISGGKVFAHNDEQGIIFQLDYITGNLIKKFSIGKQPVAADIEDIAVVDKRLFVVISNGEILEFSEAADGSYSSYKSYSTGLTVENDVEGICYDNETNSLLLACKGYPGRGLNGYRAVYSFSLKDNKLNPTPRFKISLSEITSKLDIEDFSPSSIRKHPGTNTYFILSAKDRAIIELSSQGKIIGYSILNKKLHKKPEGIDFTSDFTMLISDEGKKNNGRISRYSYIK